MAQLKWVNSRYEILAPIGSGSSSRIYKAIDHKDPDESVVVVKILTQLPDSKPEYLREFFEREVRSLSSLNHPRIIRLLDSGYDSENNFLFIVLEYIERAATLRERITKAWSPEVNDVMDVLVDLLDSLSYSHQAYIIHRDLNPSNILIDGTGNIKVIDFGVSKILGTLHAGETVGDFYTRAYASPEQIAYKDIDFSTDLYSLAGVAYFMLTKKDPDPSIPLESQIRGVAKLSQELSNVLSRMAAPVPLERFESALQASLALRNAKNQTDAKSQWVFLKLTQKAIVNLYEQAIIKSQDPNEAKSTIQKLLGGEVFVVRDEEAYDIIGDGISIRCVLGDKINAEYHTFLAVSIKATITPHQLEKIRQDGYPLFTNWKIGFSQDPLPTRFRGLNFLLDQIDNYINNKLIDKKVRERRADLVDGWMGILELDKEIKGDAAFQVEYSSWQLQQNNYVVAVKVKGDKNLENFIAPDQTLMMSVNRDRKIPVGRFLKQEGNTVYLSRFTETEMGTVSQNGYITTDERQWAAAWSRQRNALITIINGMSVNPKLPDILLDPLQASLQLQTQIDNFYTPDLDKFKKEVVTKALSARDIYLIQGPPGTGKTVVITEIIAQELARKPKAKILLVSQSNVAVDHVLKKVGTLLPNTLVVRIGKEDLISLDASKYQIDKKVRDWAQKSQARSEEHIKSQINKTPERERFEFCLEIVNQLISNISRSVNQPDHTLSDEDKDASLKILQEEYPELKISNDTKSLGELHKFLTSRLDELRSPIELILQEWKQRLEHIDDFENEYLQGCSIVAGTCVGIVGRKKLPERFDLTIVDEAGRATPSELLISLVRSDKCILVGDHKQLPPVFDYELRTQVKTRNEIDPIWMDQSLFEYLFNNLDEKLKSTLKLQYRMHPSIARMIGNVFYKNEGLETAISSEERSHGWSRWTDSVIWCSTSQLNSKWEVSTADGSKYNLSEVKIIINELKQLENELKQLGQKKSVAIISGYSAQVEQLTNQIDPKNDQQWKHITIEINTVDAFQGKEEDIVFYSVVRSNKAMELGFLGDFRRLNVALSRARELLFIVGDHRMVSRASSRYGNPFQEVVAYILEHSQECTLKELTDEES